MATSFFGGDFFGGEFFNSSTTPVVVPLVTSGGGGGFTGPHILSLPPRIPSIEERQKAFRKLLGLEAEVVLRVAERQVEDLHLDEAQRIEELYREFELEEIQIETRHIEALNLIREQLIEQEIGEILRRKIDEEEAMLLIVLGAYLT